MKYIQDYIDNSSDDEIITDFTNFLLFTLNCESKRIVVESALRELMKIIEAREFIRRRA